MDFLFDYYGLRQAQLLRWSPGIGVTLTGTASARFLAHRGFAETEKGVHVDPTAYPVHRRSALRWMVSVLEETQRRPPFFGCFGLHEWAMVYQAPTVRHTDVPLRVDKPTLDAFVSAQPVCCSHFDAFRFFTPAARPLNRLQPERATMNQMEQPGCLHANMDILRWASKMFPWVASDIVADAFLLACRIREVDMRASPYDLSAWGFEPIPIETPAGRATYREWQQCLYEEALPVRQRLIDAAQLLTTGCLNG